MFTDHDYFLSFLTTLLWIFKIVQSLRSRLSHGVKQSLRLMVLKKKPSVVVQTGTGNLKGANNTCLPGLMGIKSWYSPEERALPAQRSHIKTVINFG
jgi:hypothetical protein